MQEIIRFSNNQIAKHATQALRRDFYNELSVSQKICLVLTGLRGIGKTTAICQYLAEQRITGRKVLYYSCDSSFGEDLSLFDIAKTFSTYDIIAFDEVHKRKNWDLQIKNIVDNFPAMNFLVSGSSSLKIKQADLSRRHIKLRVKGLSFREYLRFKFKREFPKWKFQDLLLNHIEIGAELIEICETMGIDIVQEFHIYLKAGYFPTIFSLGDDEFIYHQTLIAQISQVLTEDILELYPELSGESIMRMKRLLKIISKISPFTTDLAKIKETLQIHDNRTVKNYLHYLEEAELLNRITKESSLYASLKKPEKILLENPNFNHALAILPPDAEVNIGALRESFVVNALKYATTCQLADKGDFVTGDGTTLEVGGKSKNFKQIAKVTNSYLLCDNMVKGECGKIPLWMLGFLENTYKLGEDF